MPQKRMAARGQSAKLAKGPSLKKAPKEPVKKAKASAPPANKIKTNGKTAAKDNRPEAQILKAKAALKKETSASAIKAKAPAVKPTAAKTTAKAPEAPKVETKAKPEGKRGRKISIDINPNEAASALSGKWNTLFKKAEQIEAKPYNMKNVFEEKTAITHKVLGWGYILANRNDRLEVLFKDGIKYLISNYKP
jgi:hypothetical protein